MSCFFFFFIGANICGTENILKVKYPSHAYFFCDLLPPLPFTSFSLPIFLLRSYPISPILSPSYPDISTRLLVFRHSFHCSSILPFFLYVILLHQVNLPLLYPFRACSFLTIHHFSPTSLNAVKTCSETSSTTFRSPFS